MCMCICICICIWFILYLYFLLIFLQLSVSNPISVPKSRHYANPPKTLRKAIKLLINLIYQKSVQLTRNSHHLSWLLLGVNLFSGQSINLLVIPKWSGGKNNVGRLVGIVYRYSQTFPHVVDNRHNMYIFFGPLQQGRLERGLWYLHWDTDLGTW